MRSLIFVLALVLALVLLYMHIKNTYDKITFSFRFIGTSFTPGNILQLLSQGTTQTQVRVGTKVTNKSSYEITISDFSAQIYYKDALIAQTLPGSLTLSKVKVPANGEVEIIDDLSVFVSLASVELLQQILGAKKPVIVYRVSGRIYGIPFTFKGNYTWE